MERHRAGRTSRRTTSQMNHAAKPRAIADISSGGAAPPDPAWWACSGSTGPGVPAATCVCPSSMYSIATAPTAWSPASLSSEPARDARRPEPGRDGQEGRHPHGLRHRVRRRDEHRSHSDPHQGMRGCMGKSRATGEQQSDVVQPGEQTRQPERTIEPRHPELHPEHSNLVVGAARLGEWSTPAGFQDVTVRSPGVGDQIVIVRLPVHGRSAQIPRSPRRMATACGRAGPRPNIAEKSRSIRTCFTMLPMRPLPA